MSEAGFELYLSNEDQDQTPNITDVGAQWEVPIDYFRDGKPNCPIIETDEALDGTVHLGDYNSSLIPDYTAPTSSGVLAAGTLNQVYCTYAGEIAQYSYLGAYEQNGSGSASYFMVNGKVYVPAIGDTIVAVLGIDTPGVVTLSVCDQTADSCDVNTMLTVSKSYSSTIAGAGSLAAGSYLFPDFSAAQPDNQFVITNASIDGTDVVNGKKASFNCSNVTANCKLSKVVGTATLYAAQLNLLAANQQISSINRAGSDVDIRVMPTSK